MRVAIISTYPPSKGSLNEYAYHFVSHLQQKSEVSELILLVDELPAGEAYPVISERVRIVPTWRFGALTNPLRIWRKVRALKPDAVLFNIQFATFGATRVSGALGLLAPVLVKLSGCVTVVLLHNLMDTIDLNKAGFESGGIMERLTRGFGWVFTKLLLRADLVAVTIPKYVEILEKKYGADNAFLAPHGAFEQVAFPKFDHIAQPLQIMTFGKFGTYKRVEILLDAFQILSTERPEPLELIIAGTDSPNATGYLKEVQERYAHLRGVHFTGYVAEESVPRLFQDAAVVVFPYNSTTGSSGVLHQAGNYGKAVVLPRIGDFAELIQDEGYTGEFFEAEDPTSLAAAIRRYIDDPQLRQQAGTQNYLAAVGIPMDEVVDWYLIHFERLQQKRSLEN
jgi:glycosyltransferase involved in cell wall biosynthesis